MSREQVLKSLEATLESFLERMLEVKAPRFEVLDGLSRLDDIAAASADGFDVTDQVGEWFASHNRWLSDKILRSGDLIRINRMLGEVKDHLETDGEASPAVRKIISEMRRWSNVAPMPGRLAEEETTDSKVVLKRSAETATELQDETIPAFEQIVQRCREKLRALASDKRHLLSVLDAGLTEASKHRNKEALLLSALIIYYLKLDAYKVEPFVRRLKEAERLVHAEASHA